MTYKAIALVAHSFLTLAAVGSIVALALLHAIDGPTALAAIMGLVGAGASGGYATLRAGISRDENSTTKH